MEKHFKKPWRCAELLFKFCDTPSGHGSTRPTNIATRSKCDLQHRAALPGLLDRVRRLGYAAEALDRTPDPMLAPPSRSSPDMTS